MLSRSHVDTVSKTTPHCVVERTWPMTSLTTMAVSSLFNCTLLDSVCQKHGLERWEECEQFSEEERPTDPPRVFMIGSLFARRSGTRPRNMRDARHCSNSFPQSFKMFPFSSSNHSFSHHASMIEGASLSSSPHHEVRSWAFSSCLSRGRCSPEPSASPAKY